jgi:hypothetical protein
VLHIDDLHWGDVDSAHLLVDILQPPDPPSLLLITSYRSTDTNSVCLRALNQALGRGQEVERRELAVEPLSPAETAELVRRWLGRDADQHAAIIARESGGNPFFITEFVQEIKYGTERPDGRQDRGPVSLERLIRSRVAGLPDGARRLLEVVAVSGRPLAEAEACRAADVGAEARTLLARLESVRFLRGIGLADETSLETYHDRVRETVVASLGPEPLRQHHRRLAQVLEESGGSDPEQVAVHFEGAGEPEQAASYFAKAAARAAEALAFDQAANLYRKSLDLRPVAGAEGRRLRTQLAEALANAGRSSEAGSAYLAVVEGADAEEALELRRRAALQLLMSDRVREGVEVLRAVLATVGIGLVDGPRRKLLMMMIERARLRLRGLDFQERSADSIPGHELLQVDACEAAFRGMCLVDTVRSTLFSARHLRLALDAGEPRRVTMGLAVEAANTSLDGGRSRARAERVLQKATSLAERLQQPFLLAYTALYGGITAWATGRWKEGLALCDRAAQIVNERQVLFAEESPKLQHFTFDCLLMLGQMREISARLPRFLLDARRRGDRFAISGMLVHSYAPCLMAGRPDEADQVIHQAEEEWTHHGLFMVNYWALYGRIETALYRGEGEQAWKLVQEGWPALSRSSFFAFIETLLLLLVHARARAALAAAEAAPPGGRFGPRARLLRWAARDARKIERRRMPWSDPLAKLIHAGIAAQNRQGEQTLALLAAAEKEFTAADMELYAAAARRRKGELVGGEVGRGLVSAACASMTGQDIHDPDRVAAMLAPGFRVSNAQV